MQRSALSLALAAVIALPAAAQEVETVVVTGSLHPPAVAVRVTPSPLVTVTSDDLAADWRERVGRRARGPDDQHGLAEQPRRVHAEFHDRHEQREPARPRRQLDARADQRPPSDAERRGDGPRRELRRHVVSAAGDRVRAHRDLEGRRDGPTARGRRGRRQLHHAQPRSKASTSSSRRKAAPSTRSGTSSSRAFGRAGGDRHARCSSRSAISIASRLTTYERRLSSPTDDLSQAGNPGSFLVPSLPGNPAYRSVWTAAFDGDRNGVADFRRTAARAARPFRRAAARVRGPELHCDRRAGSEGRCPRSRLSVPSPIGTIPIGLCQFDFGGFYSIVPEETRSSAFAGVTHAFGDALEGRLELHISPTTRRCATTRRRSRSRRSRASQRAIPTTRTAPTCASSAASSAPAEHAIQSIPQLRHVAPRGLR